MQQKRPHLNPLILALALAAVLMIWSVFTTSNTPSGTTMSYSTVVHYFEHLQVTAFTLDLNTGVTLSNLVPMLKMRHPNSVRICAILDKPARRKTDIRADYTGFEVPDAFVVGYGLDYDEKYRNLPFVGVLKPEVYGGE